MIKTKLAGRWLAFLLLATSTSVTGVAQKLREQADQKRILIGAAVDPSKFTETAYAETLAREFNMIEPENVMKWGAIRPTQEQFNFTRGDLVVAFAEKHNMKVRGHCLLWSEYNPGWLERGNFTPEQMSELLQEHISRVMKHYAGKVFAWDVVNESFLADGTIETSVWYDRPGIGFRGKGTAYIEQAFRWARAADPVALLFYNDYDTEGLNPKSDAVYKMVKDFKKRGVPIDGVGIQAHIVNFNRSEIASIAANLKRLTDLGLQVHITEMDVGLPLGANGSLANPGDLSTQADIYAFIAKACFEQPGCTAFQTWGFTDKYSWIPGYTKGKKGQALIFDREYATKPAYQAVLEALQQAHKR